MAIELIGAFICGEEDIAKLKNAEYRTPLENSVDTLYVTFQNEPEIVDRSLFGKPVDMKITGYGCNGRNEGFLVELYPEDVALKEKAEPIPTPVIAMSYYDSEPKKTRMMPFYTVDQFTVSGIFGAIEDGKVIFE